MIENDSFLNYTPATTTKATKNYFGRFSTLPQSTKLDLQTTFETAHLKLQGLTTILLNLRHFY